MPDTLGVRSCVLRPFPYAIVYLELPDEILILAIAHAKREPGYWQRRPR